MHHLHSKTIFMVLLFLPILALAEKWSPEDGGECIKRKSRIVCHNITSVPSFPDSENIKSLNITWSSLTIIEEDDFEDLPFLFNLNLQHSKIELISSWTFFDQKMLIDVDLSHNRIRTIEPDTFLENNMLLAVDLSYNPLDQIAPDRPFLVSDTLMNLNISHCKITTLSEKSFSKMRFLLNLDLSYNRLTTVGEVPLNTIMPTATFDLDNNLWVCQSKSFKDVACLFRYQDSHCFDKNGIKVSYFCDSIGNVKMSREENYADSIRRYTYKQALNPDDYEEEFNARNRIKGIIGEQIKIDIFPSYEVKDDEEEDEEPRKTHHIEF